MDISADWMESSHAEFFRVLMALLPGLVTVAIIYSLTVRQSLSALERIIQALLYTFLDNITWYGILSLINLVLWAISVPHHWIKSWPDFFGVPDITQQLVCLGLCGAGWGLLMTWVINCGKIHDFLANRFKITKRTSRPSEWYDAFYRFDSDYAVVHLKDGRRIFGWPRLYPDTPDEGHLVLEDAEWLRDIPVESPRLRMMVPVAQVDFIEFVPKISGTELGETACPQKNPKEPKEAKTETASEVKTEEVNEVQLQ